jgi:hypothetical protein
LIQSRAVSYSEHLVRVGRAVEIVAEHLEQAVQFELMASGERDPKLKDLLRQQALAYRKLAEKRAASLKLPPINLPAVVPPKKDGPP